MRITNHETPLYTFSSCLLLPPPSEAKDDLPQHTNLENPVPYSYLNIRGQHYTTSSVVGYSFQLHTTVLFLFEICQTTLANLKS